MGIARTRWYHELDRYHWFVLTVAALGWLFDCLDQQLFTLARRPAMIELLASSPGVQPPQEMVTAYSGYATSIFLLGWASGGLGFGVLGDRIGRAKTMLWTILLYSAFTGLTAFATNFWDFALYRFLTGLGVGGEFAVGISLVAEVMPERARPFALGLLQALSTVGNVTAALVNIGLGTLESQGAFSNFTLGTGHPIGVWRLMFLIGVLPALLAVVIRSRLKEPKRWQQAVASEREQREVGSYAALFGDPRWRRRAIAGMFLASAGVIGLWAVAFFAPDLTQTVLRKSFEEQGVSPEEMSGKLKVWAGITLIMLNIGAFLGIYAFSYITHFIGRKPAFAISFVLAAASTVNVFLRMETYTQIFWMVPLMGFCQFALFGGYAIYFPELFPTRLRSTGTSFCYNVGRFVAAGGPFTLALLTGVFRDVPEPGPLRYAGAILCSVFLVGLLVLPFLPETRGQPLPE